MSEIVVTNREWEILDDFKTAITNATISAVKVFNYVAISHSEEHAYEVQMEQYPTCVLVYDGTTDTWGAGDDRACQMHVNFMVGTMIDTDVGTFDETARVKELLRLINAVKNAVYTDLPDCVQFYATENEFFEDIGWGEITIEIDYKQPWIVAKVSLDVGFPLSGQTGH